MEVPIPVRNMWWAQTTKDIKPKKISELTIAFKPQRGLLVLLAITSATTPNAGRIRT